MNCYLDVTIEVELNSAPEKIAGIINEQYVYIMVGDSMILSEADDTHLTVFNPDEELFEIIRTLASAEGLFVWQPWGTEHEGIWEWNEYKRLSADRGAEVEIV